MGDNRKADTSGKTQNPVSHAQSIILKYHLETQYHAKYHAKKAG